MIWASSFIYPIFVYRVVLQAHNIQIVLFYHSSNESPKKKTWKSTPRSPPPKVGMSQGNHGCTFVSTSCFLNAWFPILMRRENIEKDYRMWRKSGFIGKSGVRSTWIGLTRHQWPIVRTLMIMACSQRTFKIGVLASNICGWMWTVRVTVVSNNACWPWVVRVVSKTVKCLLAWLLTVLIILTTNKTKCNSHDQKSWS